MWGQHEKIKTLNSGVDEGEVSQVKDMDEIFSNIIEDNFPKLRQNTPIKIKAQRTPNKQNQEKKLPSA